MRSFLAFVLCFLVGSCSPTKIEAISFACPTSGTTTVITETPSKTGGSSQQGEYIKPASQTREIWLGSDPSDPEVCLRKVGDRPQQRLLYGIYILPTKGEDGYRSGLRQIFGGATHAGCFEKLDRPINSPSDAPLVSYTICISGRGMMDFETSEGPTRVLIILVSSSGNGFVGDYVFFYDPTRHFFVGRNNSATKGFTGLGMRRTMG